MKGETIKILGFLFLLVVFVSSVTALSFGATPSKGIEAYAGETVTRQIAIQNLIEGSPNIKMEGSVEEGQEVLSLPKKLMDVPSGEIVMVPLRITIPEGTPIGTEYSAVIKYATVKTEDEGGGMVSFVSNLKKRINIVVVEKPEGYKPERNYTTIVLLVLSIIIILVIIWLVLKNRKQKEMAPVKSQLADGKKKQKGGK
jgi:Na+-transporting methylmalonyl-CoA/oxaloacetate decarboxylase gamma subunit